jgi:hypothetical protein
VASQFLGHHSPGDLGNPIDATGQPKLAGYNDCHFTRLTAGRFCTDPRSQRTNSRRPVDLVGRHQDRAVSEAGQARPTHDRLEGRGYPPSYREVGVTLGEAVQLPPRQNPSDLIQSQNWRPESARTGKPSCDGSRLGFRPQTIGARFLFEAMTFAPSCARDSRSSSAANPASSIASAVGRPNGQLATWPTTSLERQRVAH